MNNNIVVLGNVSVGKSTLLNSIIGHKFFNIGDGITTTEPRTYPYDKINLVDLPGNIDNSNLNEYSNIIQDAMAVLYVCDAQSVCNSLQMLPLLISIRRRLTNLNIYPILNKVDEITYIESVRKEFNIITSNLGIKKIEIMEISAKMILLIKLYNSNALDNLSTNQLLCYVMGKNNNGTKEDITQSQVKSLYSISGFSALEAFFEKFSKQTDHNLYIEIINNSHLIPVKTYLQALQNYNRNHNRIIKLFVSNCIPWSVFLTLLLCIGCVVTLFIYAYLIYYPHDYASLLMYLVVIFLFLIVLALLLFVITKISVDAFIYVIFKQNYLARSSGDITCIEVKDSTMKLIKNFYLNSMYSKMAEYPYLQFSDYIDITYFNGMKYSDFVFLNLHDKVFQIHGIFSVNKIVEVTFVTEVVPLNSRNKNPLNIMRNYIPKEN